MLVKPRPLTHCGGIFFDVLTLYPADLCTALDQTKILVLVLRWAVPVRRGFWGNKIGRPHTVPCKVTGKCGSVWVRLIPAPPGTGSVTAPGPQQRRQMAGFDDGDPSPRGAPAMHNVLPS